VSLRNRSAAGEDAFPAPGFPSAAVSALERVTISHSIAHMHSPTRIVRLSLIILAVFPASAAQPVHNFSDKPVAELLSLLESTDATVRHCAAMFIGERYRNPKAIVVNGPIIKPNSPAPEFPIPDKVIPALTAHLKTDADWAVRVCALFALSDLRFHTDTTPIVALALDDKDKLIRIRACTALIDISHDYSEPLHAKTIPTLIGCLDSRGEDEQIWQAAYASGQLGPNGGAVFPALRTLTMHDSPKVRHYAQEALSRIVPTIVSARAGAGAAPAKLACEDAVSKAATLVPKLDSPLFHESKTSLNWWVVESESGEVNDTSDGKIGPDDLVRIEHTASCKSTHQGEHLMEFCEAVQDVLGVRLSLSGGMPAYASSLRISIDSTLAFRCEFSAAYPAPTPPLRWKITKKELQLRSRDFTPGQRVFGWISVTFEETEAVKGARPKTYQIEGYIKPVIQHQP